MTNACYPATLTSGIFLPEGDFAFNNVLLNHCYAKGNWHPSYDCTSGAHIFANGAATAAFASIVSEVATPREIHANSSSSNEAGIEALENLPDNPEAIYQEGRKLAAAQDNLNVDESVQYDARHAFCPETCNTSTIRYRSSASDGVSFLKNNSDYRLLLGSHSGGRSSIYPSASGSSYVSYPVGSVGYRRYFIGTGSAGFGVTGAQSVLKVIAHETGHGAGLGHGAAMRRREYDAIMRSQ